MRDLSEYSCTQLTQMRNRALGSGRFMAFAELTEQLGGDLDPEAYGEFSQERRLLELYHAEMMSLADGMTQIGSRPALVARIDNISYRFSSRREAEEIVGGFRRDRETLRGIVCRVTGDRGFAESLDYNALLSEATRIRRIASHLLEGKR